MIYNSNPYKRKMESMSINVSVPKAKTVSEDNPQEKPEAMVETQPILEQPIPYAPATPEINVTPYVPEVEGVEVPAVSLDDIIPDEEKADSQVAEEVEVAQPEEVEAPAEEVVEEVESEVEEVPVVDSSEPASPEQEEVVEDEPAEEAEAETPVDATGEETVAEDVPATHYFYCTKPDGTEAVYKRNTASASYESEIASFRKYLEKEGIIINKEEIK